MLDEPSSEHGLAAAIPTTHEGNNPPIEQQLLAEVNKFLLGPDTITLQYPGESPTLVANKKVDPHYEDGGTYRLIALQQASPLGRDEFFLVMVDNASKKNDLSLGSSFARAVTTGQHSHREIGIMRFVQTPAERLTGGGTYYIFGLSDSVTDKSGRFAHKAKAYRQVPVTGPHDKRPEPFANRWADGSAQLAGQPLFLTHGERMELKEEDIISMINGLKNSKLDKKQMQLVTTHEIAYRQARVQGSETPLLTTSTPLQLKPGTN